jgi:sirohydrochlorin cobaltochelatase
MTSDTILLVGHGSREASGNDEILAFAQQWRQRQPNWAIEVCFIELADITLAQGLATAAAQSSRVMVVPLILNAAGHVKMDIPQAIDAARVRFPRVQFLYTPELTACDLLLKVVLRRLKTAMKSLDMPDPTTTGVVLLGRGSSDRHANGEMAKMARWVMEETDHPLVDVAFTGITYPRLEKVVQRQHLLGMTQVAVLPYYLFNGTLMERIVRQVANLKTQYPTVRFALTDYFGFEPEVFEVLEQRVNDARLGRPAAMMACDGCKFREFAAEHGQGGHLHDDGTHHGHDHAHPHEHSQEHDHPHEHEHGHHHPHVGASA